MPKALRTIIGKKPTPTSTSLDIPMSPNRQGAREDEKNWVKQNTVPTTDVTNPEDDSGENFKSSVKKDESEAAFGHKKRVTEDQIDELTGKGKLETIKKNAEDTMKSHPVSKQYERSLKASKRNPDRDKKNLPIKRGAISTIQRVNGLINVRDKTQYADNSKDFLKDKNRRDSDRRQRKRMHLSLKNEK